jgi:hypothetical protein
MTAAATPDDDMPAEIDFSGGTRGKFHRPNAKLKLPAAGGDGQRDERPDRPTI